MQSYAEDCLHDSIFKGPAPAPKASTVSPSRIAVPDTIEEENTGEHSKLSSSLVQLMVLHSFYIWANCADL